MSEETYDREIAPKLMELAIRCKELGMPFVAAVEYSPGSRGTTASSILNSNIDMQTVYLAARHGSQLDDLIMSLARIIIREKLPHSCIVLNKFGVAPSVEDRD